MMLLNSLYNIIDKTATDDGWQFSLHLIPSCFIYKAHFPEHPITPGVCVIQMALELAEDILGCKLRLIGTKNVKFLSVMSPDIQTNVVYSLSIKDMEDDTVKVQAVVKSETAVYAKMSLICSK